MEANNIIAETVELIKKQLKALIKKITIASTGSIYIKIRTRDGLKTIRVADHKCGKRGGQNCLDIRADREEYFGGKVVPCCDMNLVLEKINAIV